MTKVRQLVGGSWLLSIHQLALFPTKQAKEKTNGFELSLQ